MNRSRAGCVTGEVFHTLWHILRLEITDGVWRCEKACLLVEDVAGLGVDFGMKE